LKLKPLYLDSAASTPVDPRVKGAMLPYFSEIFGNASSQHIYGKEAKNAIETAREHVANLINAEPEEIYFTSGATEAINWALKGLMSANPQLGNHIITVKTEHRAVLSTCEYLETIGYEITYLDVDKNGMISLDDLKSAIKKNTAMIAVMYVNNEIGIIQDIKGIGGIARENKICFFCDATQAIGKVLVDVIDDQIDILCLSGHKFNGPKGIGALFIKKGIQLTPLIHGGGQENNMRGGTYNTPLIVGLGEACRIAEVEFDQRIAHLTLKKEKWENYFISNNIGVVNFSSVKRAPHILSITLNAEEADEFLMRKSKEFVASTGSACSSQILEESHVIIEIFPNNNHQKTIRISI
jgi:cysteine desulfurase